MENVVFLIIDNMIMQDLGKMELIRIVENYIIMDIMLLVWMKMAEIEMEESQKK